MQYFHVRLTLGLNLQFMETLLQLATPARDDVHRFDNQQRPLLLDKQELCWDSPQNVRAI